MAASGSNFVTNPYVPQALTEIRAERRRQLGDFEFDNNDVLFFEGKALVGALQPSTILTKSVFEITEEDWPTLMVVWDMALKLMPTHNFRGEHFDTNVLVNFYNGFAASTSPTRQLEYLLPDNMNREFAIISADLPWTTAMINDMSKKCNYNWLAFVPPVQWQLQQALCCAYLAEKNAFFWSGGNGGRFYPTGLGILFYFQTEGYQTINRQLRLRPDLMPQKLDPIKSEVIAIDYKKRHDDRKVIEWDVNTDIMKRLHPTALFLQWTIALLPPLPRECMVYRYVQGDPTHILPAGFMNKPYITLHGFTSTTMNRNYVFGTLEKKKEAFFIMEIALPERARCLSWPSTEYEVVLAHGCVLEFLRTYEVEPVGLDINHPNYRKMQIYSFVLINDGWLN